VAAVSIPRSQELAGVGGRGLVQAFIIDLYAEMNGFPLTIYLLVRLFVLDRGTLSANLWSTLLGIGEPA
jgi:hypothetical protein